MNDSSTLKSILLLAADPKGTVSLRLQEEEREIKERLRLAGYGKVPINTTGATRTRDIQQAMLDFKPQIVHFTGHGAGKDGLAFEDGTGQPKLVDSDALANLFKLFSSHVECVVLNACYSQVQAEAIAQHIDYVIGMSQAIGDRDAIEFSVGFYIALGAGESVEFAYKLGCNAIQLAGSSEYLTPVLFDKKGLSEQSDIVGGLVSLSELEAVPELYLGQEVTVRGSLVDRVYMADPVTWFRVEEEGANIATFIHCVFHTQTLKPEFRRLLVKLKYKEIIFISGKLVKDADGLLSGTTHTGHQFIVSEVFQNLGDIVFRT
jgi:hypothetical protein